MRPRKKDSLLWQIGNEAPYSYLFGTMHVRDQTAYTFADIAKDYIERCQQYCGEMNLDEAQMLAQPADFQMPDNKTMPDLIGPKQFNKARRIIFKSTGLDLLPLRQLYPMLITNTVAESMLNQEHQLPLDHFLWESARVLDLPLFGLETYREQQETMHKISMDDQVRQFNQMWRRIRPFRRQLLNLCRLYAQGKIHELYRTSVKSMGSMKSIMVYNRNQHMADRIINLIDLPTFISVGAGHLGGAKGILHILKSRGITCRPIHFNPEIAAIDVT